MVKKVGDAAVPSDHDDVLMCCLLLELQLL